MWENSRFSISAKHNTNSDSFSKLKKLYFFLVNYVIKSPNQRVFSPPAPGVVSKPSTGLTALHLLLRKGENLQFIQVTWLQDHGLKLLLECWGNMNTSSMIICVRGFWSRKSELNISIIEFLSQWYRFSFIFASKESDKRSERRNKISQVHTALFPSFLFYSPTQSTN